jgi:hypothetical protein
MKNTTSCSKKCTAHASAQRFYSAVCFAFASLFFCAPLAAQQSSASKTQIQFIKGNINDKTAAVRQSSGSGPDNLAEAGIDFCIMNSSVLGSDRDLSALAVASVLALPKDNATLTAEKASQLSEKLISVFSLFDDDTVRISVIERLVPLSQSSKSDKAVSLMNSFLKSEIDANKSSSPVHRSAITALGDIGNSESYSIIYNCWKVKQWPQFSTEIEQALVDLSVTHIADAIKVFSVSKPADDYAFFSLIAENSKIPPEFKSEIAENALSGAIHSTDDLSGITKETVSLQLDSVHVISSNNWTRAAPLVIRYFALACEEYAAQVLSEDQFVDVIHCTTALASSDTASTLSDYLAELNRNTEKGSIPSKSVVLAVISSLGALGDKTAFDNLLYVTYLNYPDEVIAAARDALAKLKW